MDANEAKKVYEKYNSYDSKFREAKKAKRFGEASEWKAKRDALSEKLSEAVKILAAK